MLASNSSLLTSSSKAAPNWGTSMTHPTLYGPIYPQTHNSKSVTIPLWADGWVKHWMSLFPFEKACKIWILIPLCLFVRRNSSVMTENEQWLPLVVSNLHLTKIQLLFKRDLAKMTIRILYVVTYMLLYIT